MLSPPLATVVIFIISALGLIAIFGDVELDTFKPLILAAGVALFYQIVGLGFTLDDDSKLSQTQTKRKIRTGFPIIAILAISIFSYNAYTNSPDIEYKTRLSALEKIQSIADYHAYIKTLPKQNDSRKYLNIQNAHKTIIRERVNSNCPLNKLHFEPAVPELNLASLLQRNANSVDWVFSDGEDIANSAVAKVDYTSQLLFSRYRRPNNLDSSRNYPSGRELQGSVSINNGPPQYFEATIEPPQNISLNATSETLKAGTLRRAFDAGFRPAFAKAMVDICEPTAIAAFYLNYIDPERDGFQSINEFERSSELDTLAFAEDSQMDEFILAHIGELAPLFYLIAENAENRGFSGSAKGHLYGILEYPTYRDRLPVDESEIEQAIKSLKEKEQR